MSYEAGRRARDIAMSEAERAANEAWKVGFIKALIWAARNMPELTTDDVHKRMDPSLHTHEPRASGQLMIYAAKQGWILKTERTRPSDETACHIRPKTVWVSLLYRDPVH